MRGRVSGGARGNLNEGSIGIEIVNLGYVDGPDGRRWLPFTQTQIDALIPLARDIIERYHIAPYNVVAHADIAPQRKLDPGPLFPWQRLAQNGIGAWPDAETVAYNVRANTALPPIRDIQQKLQRYGYPIEVTERLDAQTHNVLRAFQMHFRPTNFDGEPDRETLAILDALLAKYTQPPLVVDPI